MDACVMRCAQSLARLAECKDDHEGRTRTRKRKSLPTVRANAIKAASVPDSDRRFEPGAVLCIPEFILGERFCDAEKSYRITWLNLDDSYNTWQPASAFDGIEPFALLIENWEAYKHMHGYKLKRYWSSKAKMKAHTTPAHASAQMARARVSTRIKAHVRS